MPVGWQSAEVDRGGIFAASSKLEPCSGDEVVSELAQASRARALLRLFIFVLTDELSFKSFVDDLEKKGEGSSTADLTAEFAEGAERKTELNLTQTEHPHLPILALKGLSSEQSERL